MEAKFSGGQSVAITKAEEFGRGRPACFTSVKASRTQFRLEPIPGVSGVLKLDNLGTNPLIVELHEKGEDGRGSWEMKEFLEKGMNTLVGPGHRFYIASCQEDTMVTLSEVAHVHTSTLSSQEEEVEEEEEVVTLEPTTKRPRISSVKAGASMSCLPKDSPISLFWVRGLDSSVNQHCLGARLRNLVKGPMAMAFIENFMIDLGWLLSACPDLKNSGHTIIAHGESGELEENIKATAKSAGLENVVVHRPPLPVAYGTHHSKAFILKYPRGLRVIVHTANLIFPDCNNKTQGVWYQDFPTKTSSSPESSPFEKDLLDYLSQLKLPAAAAQLMKQMCHDHDFSCARGALVASVPGYHVGTRMHQYGHMRLRHLLSQQQLPTSFSSSSPLMCQCSSLGSLDEKWLLSEFVISLKAGKLGRSRPAGSAGILLPSSTSSSTPLFFVWPTVEEVKNSLEGWVAGYSIPGPQKNVGKPFLRQYMCPFGGEHVGRTRAMPHIKTYTRFEGQQMAWFLTTSHNLSKAAWGSLQKQGQQLMIRSYELGILCLPQLEAKYRASQQYGFSCDKDMEESVVEDGSQKGSGEGTNKATSTAGRPEGSTSGQHSNSQEALQPEVEFWSLQQWKKDMDDARDAALVGEETTRQEHLLVRTTPTPSTGPAAAAGGDTSTCQPEHGAQDQAKDRSVVKVYLPIPYTLPPSRYLPGDLPWMNDVIFPGRDALGYDIGRPANFYNRVEPED